MASFNPDRAEVPLALPGGPTLKLVMDHQAVGAMIAKFGPEWDTKIATAIGAYDCPTLCAAVEILLAKHHPEVTAADIMAASPPWLKMSDAINAAQRVFLYGTAGPQASELSRDDDEADAEDGDQPEDGEGRPFGNGHDGRKSSHRLWRRLLRRVYGQPSSGA
jgi:hypothetical protein